MNEETESLLYKYKIEHLFEFPRLLLVWYNMQYILLKAVKSKRSFLEHATIGAASFQSWKWDSTSSLGHRISAVQWFFSNFAQFFPISDVQISVPIRSVDEAAHRRVPSPELSCSISCRDECFHGYPQSWPIHTGKMCIILFSQSLCHSVFILCQITSSVFLT